MSWSVQEVPIEFVNRTWPFVEGMLEKSVRYANGELTIQEVKVNVLRGLDVMFVALDDESQIQGVATVNLYNRTDNRVAHITNISGRLLADDETFRSFARCFVLKVLRALKGRYEIRFCAYGLGLVPTRNPP